MNKYLGKTIVVILGGLVMVSAGGCSGRGGKIDEAEPGTTLQAEGAGTGGAVDIKWPQSAISVVVGANAGGGPDTSARLYTKYLEPLLGVSMPIVNVSGGGGSLASNQVLGAKNDGYTILCANEGFLQNEISGVADYTYDSFEFGGLAILAENMALVCRSDSFRTMDELISYARENPGAVSCSVETGGTGFTAFKAIEKCCGIQISYIDGSALNERLANLIGGHCDLILAPVGVGNVQDYIDNGEVSVLFMFNDMVLDRFSQYKLGTDYGIDYIFNKFFAFYFPKGTDPAVVAKFQAALKQVAENQNFINDVQALGFRVEYIDDVSYLEEVNNKLIAYSEMYQ